MRYNSFSIKQNFIMAIMAFTKNDGRYSGTELIRYPFKIIRNELCIKARLYDLRGWFATTSLRSGCEIKDIAEVLGHRRIIFQVEKKIKDKF